MKKNKLPQLLLSLSVASVLLSACDRSNAHPLVIGSSNITDFSDGNYAHWSKVIASGDLDLVKQQVRDGTSIGLDEQGLNQSVRIAVVHGEMHILRYLLEQGAKMETERSRAFRQVGINGTTATNILSLIPDSPEILELLLQYGAKPNLVGVGEHAADKRPLLEAIRKGNLESVQVLLNYGADPNLGGESSNTAIGWTLAFNKKKILKALIRGGADVNILPGSDGSGEPLSPRQVCRMPLTHRPAPPLDMAIERGDEELVDILKDAGAQTSEQLCSGYS